MIVPTYNRSTLLGRALVSILRQSVQCAEIIVVDDASTDLSRQVVDEICKDEQGIEIRWLRLDSNRGPAAARNFGIEHCRHELIAFLDSDDHWLPEKIERQAARMELQPEYLISHTREKWLRCGQHLNQKKRHIPRHGDIFCHCLELCAVGMSTVMLRREIFRQIGMFNESMRCCEDYDFWLRASCRLPFLLIDEALTVKEGGRDDQVSVRYRVGMDRLRIEALLRLIQSGFLDDTQEEKAIRELQRKCLIYGAGCIKHGKKEEGQYYLDLAKDPSQNFLMISTYE